MPQDHSVTLLLQGDLRAAIFATSGPTLHCKRRPWFILIDHARVRNAEKRGRGMVNVPFDEALGMAAERPSLILAVDDALLELKRKDSVKARLVEMRFFGGMTAEDSAEVLEMPVGAGSPALAPRSGVAAAEAGPDRGARLTRIVGRTPWSARVPLDPLFAAGSRKGRPGGRPRTRGSAPQFSAALSKLEKRVAFGLTIGCRVDNS